MTILLIILIIISLAVLVWILGRHFAELRILNVEDLPGERERQVKAGILADRLRRGARERAHGLRQLLTPLSALASRIRQRFTGKLHELELAYERAKRLALGTRGKRTAQIMGLIREALEFERQEKFEEAERKYIAVVSLDTRNVDAYEGLGNLYLRMKKYTEAREALSFILKFRPADASVLVSLGEVALALGKPEEALPHFKQAVELRRANPKYLDFFIETAILAGSKKDALLGLKLMRAANPENQKIGEWERRINLKTS